MTNRNRGVVRRQFSRGEDELIVQQSQGLMTLSRLLSVLRTSRDVLERRAGELGVTLRVRQPVRKTAPLVPDSSPASDALPAVQPETILTADGRVFDHGANPYRNEPDLLLRRLLEEHGNRRYESVSIRKGK